MPNHLRTYRIENYTLRGTELPMSITAVQYKVSTETTFLALVIANANTSLRDAYTLALSGLPWQERSHANCDTDTCYRLLT
jgi:hypothetical protein